MLYILNRKEQIIGLLSNDLPHATPYYDDLHTENIETGLNYYTFKTPFTNDGEKMLKGENFVLFKDVDSRSQLFAIKEVTVITGEEQREIEVYAEHVAMDELLTYPVRPVSRHMNAKQAIEYVVSGSGWKVEGPEGLGKLFEFDNYMTAKAAMHSVIAFYEVRVAYDIELVGNVITKRTIRIFPQEDVLSGKMFTYDKDLKSVTRKEDTTQICTALLGVGRGDSDGNFLTFADFEVKPGDPEPYPKPHGQDFIADETLLDTWGRNGRHLFGIFIDDEATSELELYRHTAAELRRRSRPQVSYTADVYLFDRVPGYQHDRVRVGNTIVVKDNTFTPELTVSARVLEVQRSYTDNEQDNVTFGDFKVISLSGLDLINSLRNKIIANEEKWSQGLGLDEVTGIATEKAEEAVYPVKEEVGIIGGKVNGIQGKVDGMEEKVDDLEEIITIDITPMLEDLKEKEEELRKAMEALDELSKELDKKTGELVEKGNELDEKANALEKETSQIKEDAAALEEKANALGEDLGKVSKTVEDNETANKVKFEQINKEVEGTNEKLSSLSTEVTESISGINTKIQSVEANVDKKTDKEEFIQKTTEIDQSIDGVKQTVTETNKTVTAQGERLTKAETGITQNAEGIKQAAKKTEVYTKGETDSKIKVVSDKTAELEVTTSGITQKVTNVEKEVSNQGTRIKDAEAKIEVNSEAIKQTVKKDEVYTKGEMDGKITTINSKISSVEQTAEGLKTTVQETNKKIDGLDIQGRNYTLNSDFRFDKDNWTGITNPTTTAIIDIKGLPGITKGLRITSNGAFIVQTVNSENIGVFDKAKGYVSVYVDVKKYSTPKPTDSPRVYLRFVYDENGTDKMYYAIATKQGVTKGWERISVPFDTTSYKGTLKEVRINLATAGMTEVDATFAGPVVNLGSRLADWTPAIEDTSKGLDGKVGNETFTNKISQIEQNAEGIKTSVAETNKTVTAQGQRLSTAETNIKQNATNISLAAKKTDVYTKSETDSKVKVVADKAAALEVNVNKISSTVSEVQKEVDGMTVGGGNLFLNSNFKDGMKNWTQVTGVSIDKTVTFQGQPTLKSDQKGNTGMVYRGAEQKQVPFEIGQTYSASFYVRTDDINTFDEKVAIEIICERTDGTRTTTHVTNIDMKTVGNNTWSRFTATGVIPKETATVRVGCRVWKNGRVWIALPQFENGNKPSAWSPSSRDTDESLLGFTEKVSKIEQTVDGISSEVKAVKVTADGSKVWIDQNKSKVDQTAEEIKLTVKKGDVISSINQTAEKITIKVDKLDLIANVKAKHLDVNEIFANTAVINKVKAIEISADKLVGGTIHGIRYESINSANKTIKAVIEGNTFKSYGPMDTVAKKQNYAELREGGIHVFEMAESGSPFGDREAYVEPARFNAKHGQRSSALEPTELRFWVPNMTGIVSYDVVPHNGSGYGLRLESLGGVHIKSTNNSESALSFNSTGAIFFDGFGNIKGDPYGSVQSTWSIKDGGNRIKFLVPVGKDATGSNDYYAHVGGHKFFHNNNLGVAIWTKGPEEALLQFAGNANFKYWKGGNYFECKNGSDSGFIQLYASAFNTASSLVWKKDIKNFERSALDIINSADVMSYSIKQDEEDVEIIEDAHKHIGVIAEFAPEEIATENGQGIDLYAMTSLAWKAIQELKQQNEELQEKLTALLQR